MNNGIDVIDSLFFECTLESPRHCWEGSQIAPLIGSLTIASLLPLCLLALVLEVVWMVYV